MRLTVVGSGGGTGVTDEISSGYLLTSGISSLLVDCGPGVATQLLRYTPMHRLAGVVVSHMHSDHYFDLFTLAVVLYNQRTDILMRDYSDAISAPHLPRLPIYLPPGGTAPLIRMVAVLVEEVSTANPGFATALRGTLDLREFDPDAPFAVGPFTVQPLGPMMHNPGPCYAFRVVVGGATVGYTGDSGPCAALDDVARDADLFLCDAMGILSDIRTDGRHLSAEDAGRVAARAGAKHLVLTHLASTARGWTTEMIEAARRHYPGPIHLARGGKVFDIAPPPPRAI